MGKYEIHAICCSYTHTTRRHVKENKEQSCNIAYDCSVGTEWF